MISSPDLPQEAKLFCAQTLRSKVAYDLHQVPKDSRMEMKNSLVSLLENSKSRSISTQMSLALANLALQILDWNNVVPEMVQKFQASHPTALLEFLRVLPEELSDPRRTTLTDDEFRDRTTQLLTDNASEVVRLILHYITTCPTEDAALGFECLNSWLGELNLPDVIRANPSLINLLFDALGRDATTDAATECCISIFRETREVNETHDLIKNILYPQVISLRPHLSAAKDNSDLFSNLTRVLTEAGESWHVLIAREPREFRSLVEAIGECAAFDDDLEVVQYTFLFWYNLKQMLVMPKYTEGRNDLADIYLNLIDVIIHHLQYPPGNLEDLFDGDREEEDKFRSFRHEMGDVLKDCCAIVGSHEALKRAYDKVYNAVQSNATWQEIEAPLFSMRAMAREVELSENEMLPNVMKMLVQLPEHEKIRYAAILVLGRYTEWTSHHPEYLDFQLQYITQGFNAPAQSPVMSAAAQALMHFCQDCGPLLTNYIEQLYPFYEKVMPELDLESLYEVTDGIAHVIAAQPEENVQAALHHFAKPIATKLLEKANQPGSDKLYREIADQIELLTIFVKIVGKPSANKEKPNPTAQFIIELYPGLVIPLLKNHGTSSFVAERTSKFIKTCLHACSFSLEPVLPMMAETLAHEFDRTHFGCYLWVSGALLREFGSNDEEVQVDESTRQAVWQFSYRQSVAFYQFLHSTSNPKDVPDLIEDFFRFMSDVILFFPFEHIQSDLFRPSFDASIVALSLEQFEPLIATLHFLQDLFGYGFSTAPNSAVNGVPENIRNLVIDLTSKHGQELVTRLLSGLIFSFPRDTLPDASSLILTLIQLVSTQQALEWLGNTLNLLPDGSLSDEEKQKLLQRLEGAMNSGDFKRVRTLLRDFTALYARRNITPRSQLTAIGAQA